MALQIIQDRDFLDYCRQCKLYGKCEGPQIIKTSDLLGDWEDIEETSCRKFQGEKPTGELRHKIFQERR